MYVSFSTAPTVFASGGGEGEDALSTEVQDIGTIGKGLMDNTMTLYCL